MEKEVQKKLDAKIKESLNLVTQFLKKGK